MSELEQKTMQEMASDAAECITAEGAAAEATDDDLESVSGGVPRQKLRRGTRQKIYDGKGRECGYTVTNGLLNFENYYYRCPNCGRPMHYAGYDLECTPCGITTQYYNVQAVKWTKGKSSLITASTAL